MKLSVVIPVYKNKKMFLDNLFHNYQFLKNTEIIVVDDASGERLKNDIEKDFPVIKFFENKINMGFGATVNFGVKQAQGDLVFLLNSDVKLLNNDFEKAVYHFEKNSQLFAVSFLQIEKDNSLVGKNTMYFKRGLLRHQKADDLKFGLNAWAEGGSCLIRKKYFDELLGFDELYSPFYWEDLDLSYRVYKRGLKVLFDPNIKVEHHHATTIGKYYKKTVIAKIVFRNQFIFMWKNIADWDLFLSHLFFLPYYLIYRFLDGEITALIGFLTALKKLPIIFKKRNDEFKKNKLTDKEVLKLFK